MEGAVRMRSILTRIAGRLGGTTGVEPDGDAGLAALDVAARALRAACGSASSNPKRLRVVAVGLARELGLSKRDVAAVASAAGLLDIGLLAVEGHILWKPGEVTRYEFDRIRRHTAIGAQMVRDLPLGSEIARIILSHHERWDGRGYPGGLCRKEIPMGARILTVPLFFEALCSGQPNRAPLDEEQALAAVRRESGSAFDPAVVDAFTIHYPRLAAQAGDARNDAEAMRVVAAAHRFSAALVRIAQSVSGCHGVDAVMSALGAQLADLMPVSTCAFYAQEGDETMRCAFAGGVDGGLVAGFRLSAGEGPVGWVSTNAHVSADATAVVEYAPAGYAADATELKSALIGALKSRAGRRVGCLAVFSTTETGYAADHRRILSSVCDLVAGVLEGALILERAVGPL